jgi:hypothetical protein
MKNRTNFNSGVFRIIGNPIDMNLYTGVQWTFSSQNEMLRDGVEVNYSLGAMSSTYRYEIFSSQNIPAGRIYIFFVPSTEEHRTLMYYPYTFNVERSAQGFSSPNTPNVPVVMMNKRHRFEQYEPMVGSIEILNNDGTLPA